MRLDYSSLKANVEKLKSFHQKHKHFNVSTHQDKHLALWVKNIRKHETLLPDLTRKQLQRMGFDFKAPSNWDARYTWLKEFYSEHGHAYVPAWETAYEPLFDWCMNQRRGKSYLTDRQIKKLDGLAFDWGMVTFLEATWETHYQNLISFKKSQGHTRVPEGFTDIPGLAKWVLRQRKKKKEGKLTRQQISKLNAIGFLWSKDIAKLREQAWDGRYNELVRYKKKHGHIDRLKVRKDHYSLGLWMETQITHQKKISVSRKRKLNALGFQWDRGNIYDDRWNEMFSKLQAFKKKNGHCRVKRTDDYTLATWLQRQKQLHKKLNPDKQKKLDRLGIYWSGELRTQLWEKHYQELRTFQKKHGHVCVPRKLKVLYEWLVTQKKMKAENKLTRERAHKLTMLGVAWTGEFMQQRMAEWRRMYKKYVALRKRCGKRFHIKLKQDPQLNYWVSRQIHNKHELTTDKKNLLNDADFEWNPNLSYHNELWRKMYDELIAFKQQYGHCNVPQRYRVKGLGSWVNRQRTAHLSEHRKRLLNKIGFAWAGDIKENRWLQRVEEFKKLKKTNQLSQIKAGTPLYSWIYQQKKNFDRLPKKKQKLLIQGGII